MSKKIPNIKGNNITAVKDLTHLFKSEKCLSLVRLKDSISNSKKLPYYYEHPNNFQPTINFMLNHGLITRVEENGFVVFVATQKLVRSKIQPWFPREFKVCHTQLKQAVDYQAINNGKLDFKEEGRIIGKNILKLADNTLKEFIEQYVHLMEYMSLDKLNDGDFTPAINNPVDDIKSIILED